MENKILLIEDEAYQAEALIGFLKKQSYQVVWESSARQAFVRLTENEFDLILSDYRLGDGTGEEILDYLKKENIPTPFILITAFGNIDLAVRMMSKGAFTFIEKPINLNKLKETIRKGLDNYRILKENRFLKEELNMVKGPRNIIYRSKNMTEIISLCAKAAKTDVTVLITGESGTGKELVARFLHEQSSRQENNLVSVNCAALSPSLLESELFGHVKGAFTGADKQRSGRFEQAHKGTLFLDEIGEISMEIQVKLLRVLQEKKIERVGGNQSVSIDIRLITATNKNLEKLIDKGLFREDLYYRLNVFQIHLPPLRDRKEDIPILSNHFIKEFNRVHKKNIRGLSSKALGKLMNYDFPGNIRELRNMIERAFIICDNNELSESSILSPKSIPPDSAAIELDYKEGSLPKKIELLEKKEIIKALENNNGNQSKASHELGLSERVLRYKLKKFGFK